MENLFAQYKMNNKIYFEKFCSQDDFLDYWELVSNEQAMEMNGRILTKEEAKQLFEYVLQINQKNEIYGYFKVFKEDTKDFMGLGAAVINDNLTQAEIEYMLLPQYWGNKYGSEIVDRLLSKTAEIDTIQQVIAITDPTNVASQKILLKQGFSSHKIYEVDDGSLAEIFTKTV